jgi:hypothetical protein
MPWSTTLPAASIEGRARVAKGVALPGISMLVSATTLSAPVARSRK